MRQPGKCYFLYIAILSIIVTAVSPAAAQYFGRNKAQYKTFDFKVEQTPHFNIYHYLKNDSLVTGLAQASERWYLMHQLVFKDTFKTRNPIIFYNNHADFQQTSTISGMIGVGTGGVTEGLKNRIVMPLTESNAQTDHVLGHELVHAFQYHLLKSGDSTSLTSIRNLPLWMVEGLAEYMSIGSVDAHTSMWMRDAVLQEDIPSIKDLSTSNKYFPYRYGHSFWAFTAGVWGDTVIAPLFIETAKYGYEQAIENIFNFDAETLSAMWRETLKKHYGQYIEDSAQEISGIKLLSDKNSGEINISPSLSPDGSLIAFLSEKNIFTIDLFLANAKTGNIIKKLSSTVQNDHIDAFSFLESAGTWSPFSNKFAFVVFSKGKNKLSIVDVASGKNEEFELEGVSAFSNPAWSPDGDHIVVTGLVNGQSDLYLYDVTTKEVQQLTNDAYSDLQPSWSPDGRKIVFSTDRPVKNKQGHHLAILSLNNDSINIIPVFPGADNLNPAYSPDQQSIYFLSDRDGFRNLYRYSPGSGATYQLTDYFTGISGITSFSPALSIARESNSLAYSHYLEGNYTIYKANLNAFSEKPVSADSVIFAAAILPPARKVSVNIVAANLNQPEQFEPVPEDSIKQVPYKPNFKLDYISSTAGVGVSTGQFGTGLAGGVNMLFGDILGYNKIFAAASINGEIHDFGGQIGYLNQKHKINWGVLASHIPYRYSRFSIRPDTINYQGDTLEVSNLIIDNLRTFQDQIGIFSSYPISQTKRFELGATFNWYSHRYDRINNYYYQGIFLDHDEEKLDAPLGFNFQQVNFAFVGDNSYFGLASPMLGHRYRFSVQKYFGTVNFYSVLADYRKYFFFKPFSVGFRLMHHARYGQDVGNNVLPPLSISYPTLIRGYNGQSENELEAIRKGYFSPSQLFGNKTLVGNVELRLPFSGPEKLALIKSGIFFTELAFFVDGGLAWDYNQENPTDQPQTSLFEISSKPVFSTGVSFRINLFGAMVIEPFYAFPIRKNGLSGGTFGLNFSPGW